MKKKNIYIVISIICLVVIIGGIVISNNKNSNKENKTNTIDEKWENQYSNIDKNEINYQEDASVKELKEELNLQGNDELYKVSTEYDGRKTLEIKDEMQFKTAYAGIIKKSKPESVEEVEKIYNENYPKEYGIWISEESREKFLQILKDNNIEANTTEGGYLEILNNSSKELEKIKESKRKIIIDVDNLDYEVDVVSGKIVEYPFVQLDIYQTIDVIRYNGDMIIVINKNEKNNLKNQEIFSDILSNVNI